MGYGGYRPATQYPTWGTALPTSMQVRPVSSVEEVKACPIDFDGSVFYFPDIAKKRIYTKQMNLDGTSSLQIYQLMETPNTENEVPQIAVDDFVSRETFDKVIAELTAEIQFLKSQKKEEKSNAEYNF